MTHEQANHIYDEALRRYPIGTKVVCLRGWTRDSALEKKGIVEAYKSRNDMLRDIKDTNRIWIHGNHYNLCIYENGVWAEGGIESTPSLFPIY